jgi:uncharacterized protein (DUF302 family)
MDKPAYRVESDKAFDAVVSNIERLVPAHSFRVLAVHDVQSTLAEKGFKRDALKIIEVCNARFAHEVLEKDIGAAIFMPCRYTVHVEGKKTVVTLARPSMIAAMLPGLGLEPLADEVEKTLKKIMTEAVK